MSNLVPFIVDAYQPRELHFVDLWQFGEYCLKFYHIRHPDRAPLTDDRCTAIRNFVQRCFAQFEPHYPYGFIMFHQGPEADYILINLWSPGAILQQRLYFANLTAPDQYADGTNSPLMACVWELQIHAFERNAWVQHVLIETPKPDLYLAARLDIAVTF